MKHLRGIAIIEKYLNQSEIFTLYVPKETDRDYRIRICMAMREHDYITERFKWLDAEYLIFYPKDFGVPSHPKYPDLFKFRKDFCKKHQRLKPY